MKAETKGYLLGALIALGMIYLVFNVPFLRNIFVKSA